MGKHDWIFKRPIYPGIDIVSYARRSQASQDASSLDQRDESTKEEDFKRDFPYIFPEMHDLVVKLEGAVSAQGIPKNYSRIIADYRSGITKLGSMRNADADFVEYCQKVLSNTQAQIDYLLRHK